MSSTYIAGWSVMALLLFALVALVAGSCYIITKPIGNDVRNPDSATQVHDEADLAVCMHIV